MRLPTRLLRRKVDAHKGDFGHIFILAGCARFSGAAVLCAEAAMRSGAGLVSLGVPQGINNALIKIKPKEVMTLPLPQTRLGGLSFSGFRKISDFLKKADLLIIGPGLGQEKSTVALVRELLRGVNRPIVLDADALNALAGHLNLLRTTNDPSTALGASRRRTTIITPHPAEMARLLRTTVKRVQGNRELIAKKFAADYGVTLVLKGHRTIVAGEKGNIYINQTGNPGMATAGSGDVLTGIIGAFLAQGLDAFAAAKYGVYLHGLAGDIAVKEKTQISLVASDIISKIPEAVKKCS